MATLDPNFTLELTHITLGNRVFSYASMPLNPALPDASQIQVRWNVTTVYQGNPQTSGGTPVTVSTLSQTLQDEIQTLLGTMYVVDAVAKTVTINADSTIVDQITFGNYYFPGTFLVSQVTPLVFRRDTNVTNPTVVFSPGSRLTSELLNTSDSQMLNAIQEIVAFGDGNSSGGGSGGTVDLGTYSIFDLGDVSAASGSGLLSYDTGTGLVTTGASGSLLPAGGGTAEYLRKSSNVDGAVEWYDLNTELNAITGSIASNSTDITANNSAITTLQDKTQNITATSAATTIANDLNVGDDIVATNNITAGGDVVGQSIQAVNGTTHASVYAGTQLTSGGLGRARLWHSAGRLNVYGESNSGFYFGSTAGNSNMQIGSVALYSSSNNPTAGSSSVTIRGKSSLNTTTDGGASQTWTSGGGHYTYNADQNGRAMGKCVHQSSPVGYTYVNSAHEPTGTASSDRTYDLQNIDGAYRNASPSHGGAYTGGSSYYHRVRILGKDIARYTNKGAMYLNNPVNDAEFRINLSNVQSGQAGQDQIAIGMYQDDYWNGPGNARGKWTFSVRGDGYVFAKGFHNNSDPTNKDYEAPVMANNDATTKLKALTILPYRYKNDDGTADPTGPIHYGFNADEFVTQGLDSFGIVSTSGVAAESDSVDAGADIVDEAPTTEDGLPVLSSNPATALAKEDPGTQLSLDTLAVTALTVQVVQQVEARVTTLEAAPPSSGGIDSDTTTGGANTVAIANMVTIPTTDYGALTPDSGTIYFLTP